MSRHEMIEANDYTFDDLHPDFADFPDADQFDASEPIVMSFCDHCGDESLDVILVEGWKFEQDDEQLCAACRAKLGIRI